MRIADQKAEALEVKRVKAAETKKAKADKNGGVSPNGASAAESIK
jgi:hypothetical protein